MSDNGHDIEVMDIYELERVQSVVSYHYRRRGFRSNNTSNEWEEAGERTKRTLIV